MIHLETVFTDNVDGYNKNIQRQQYQEFVTHSYRVVTPTIHLHYYTPLSTLRSTLILLFHRSNGLFPLEVSKRIG